MKSDLTQRELVLAMLIAYPTVTTSDFCENYLYAFRSRIPEIQRRGIKVYRRRIKGKSIYEYSLKPFGEMKNANIF